MIVAKWAEGTPSATKVSSQIIQDILSRVRIVPESEFAEDRERYHRLVHQLGYRAIGVIDSKATTPTTITPATPVPTPVPTPTPTPAPTPTSGSGWKPPERTDASGASSEGGRRDPERSEGVSSRAWVMVRPGLVRPLAGPQLRRRLTLVFDVNHVLVAKLQDPAMRLRVPGHGEVRVGPMVFLVRPGARKLLNMLRASQHRVILWSTMRTATVRAVAAHLAPWAETRCGKFCGPDGVKDLATIDHEEPFSSATTFLFDDDPAKARLQPQCHVPVRPFDPEGIWDPIAVTDRGCAMMLAEVVKRACV